MGAPTIGDITTTTAINAFLRVMINELTEHFPKTTVLLNEVKGEAGNLIGGGRAVELPHWVLPNTAVAGVRGDAGNWAKGSRGLTGKAIVPIYPLNMVGSFGAIAELKTAADVQAIKSIVQQAVDDVQRGFPLQVNKHLFLDGKGILAKVNGAPAGNVITVSAEAAGLANYYGVHYMEQGMHLMATSDATLAAENLLTDFQVVGVDSTALTVTGEGNCVVADSQFLTVRDGLNNVPDGLLHAVGDGTTFDHGATYLSVDRSTAAGEYWRSIVKDMASAGTIETTVVSQMMAIEKRGEEAPKMVVTTFEAWNKLWREAQATRQFFSSTTSSGDSNRKYALGFSALTIALPGGQIEIFADRHCPKGEWFQINPRDFAFVHGSTQKNPLGSWYVGTDGSMYHEIPGTFRKEVVWLAFFNFVCRRPRAQLRITRVPETAL